MIRLKGDITRQLNEIYIDYTFKVNYKNELKQRILDFYNSLAKGSIAELLSFSKEYCVIEQNEIKVLNSEFVNKYKEELFNSFNPLWYSNRKIKEKKEIYIPGIELEIVKSILSFFSLAYLKDFHGEKKDFEDLLNIENSYFLDKFYYGCIKSNDKETYIYPSFVGKPKEFMEKNDLISIENIFQTNFNKDKIGKYNNNLINDYLKKIKRTLEVQSKRFNLFTFNVNINKKSFFGDLFLDYDGKFWFKQPEKYKKHYELFLDEDKEIKLVEKITDKDYKNDIYKILNKHLTLSDEIKNEMLILRIKRGLIKFLIENITKIENVIWDDEKIKSLSKFEELKLSPNQPVISKDIYGY